MWNKCFERADFFSSLCVSATLKERFLSEISKRDEAETQQWILLEMEGIAQKCVMLLFFLSQLCASYLHKFPSWCHTTE